MAGNDTIDWFEELLRTIDTSPGADAGVATDCLLRACGLDPATLIGLLRNGIAARRRA